MRNSSKTFGKLTIPIFVLLAISFSALPAQAKYGGGTGEPNDPYLIFDANHMNAIGADSNDWDKHFKLMADVDLSGYTGTEFNIIGTGYFVIPPIGFPYLVSIPFTGTFDGNGFEISNLNYSCTGTGFIYCIGLFGVVDGENAQIKNLVLKDVDIYVDPGDRIGSLIGILVNGTVIDCYTQGGSVSGDYRVGGLVGQSYDPASICNCYTDVNVSSHADIGGLVGSNYGTISNCYSKASTMGVYYVGGLAGYNLGKITDCYLTGNVSGMTNVGGLIGENHGSITNCYSTGSFEGETHVGGLAGNNNGLITICYSNGSVVGYDDVGGLVGLIWGGTITNCYTTCDVEGTESVGGLAGFNRRTVVNCYSTGRVSGTTDVGGLVGYDDLGVYNSSFWDNTVNSDLSGVGNITDPPDVIGESTTNMQIENTFTDAGWDFVGETANGTDDIWDICEGTNYPRLVWQIPLGDFLCPDGVNFFDFSFFASHWAEDNCGASNDCDGRDLDLLGSVDINDLRIFADNWLAGF